MRKHGIHLRTTGEGSRLEKQSLIDALADKRDLWEGDQVEWLFEDKAALSAGDVVIMARPDAIGRTADQREKRLKWLAERGVLVQVLPGQPELYDTPEKLIAFRQEAIAAQRARDARARAKAGKVGRPRNIEISDTDKAFICDLWYDPGRNPLSYVLATASHLAGRDVDRDQIKRWCGKARKRPE